MPSSEVWGEQLGVEKTTCEDLGFDPVRLAKVEEVVACGMDQGAYPGAVWLISRWGRTVQHGAMGLAMRTPEVRPMRPDTVFDIASITKPLFSLLVMSLIEEGKLHLDQPVSEILAAMRTGGKEKITVRHLLTHTSGIPGQVTQYRWCRSRDEILDMTYRLPLIFEPGSDVFYSSQGFMILDEVIRVILGGDWEPTFRKRFLEPLQLEWTTFRPPAEWEKDCAAAEFCPWRGYVVVGQVHDENAAVMGGVAAHAGLFSTARDLAAFGQLMLNRGVYAGRRILSERTVEIMCRNHTPGLKLARALGWQAKDDVGSPAGDLMSADSFGHTGFTGTSIWIDPKVELVAVLLTNRVHPDRSNTGIFSVRPRFYNAVRAAVLS